MLAFLTPLTPFALFWLLEAIYLGAFDLDARDGHPLQQLIGLLLSWVLWVTAWRLLHDALLGFGPILGGLLLATAAAAALLPFTTWAGFRMAGVTVRGRARTPES